MSNSIDPASLQTVVITDCGSTTTKALMFQKTESGWSFTGRGEAPTTVEDPVADVTVGVVNAFLEIQETSGRVLLEPNEIKNSERPFLIQKEAGKGGIDAYLSTSSAGGGLQMLVTGIVKEISTESAQRAALGAGAIVLDALSADDGREDHERIERIRHIKPDIVLLCGGTNGGDREHAIETAELLRAAAPRPRFGATLTLPVIYAGNSDAAHEVQSILSGVAECSVVGNVRPGIEHEELSEARDAIHELFLTHVMSHSPGYDKLLSWSDCPVMPTPAAVGRMVFDFATLERKQTLCADIGGATTDVFSVWFASDGEPIFNRTVSANLGMSYSMANVLVEAGVAAIMRWLPYSISESEVRDQLRNKMIRPTSIPQTLEDLWLEQAVCREALRLSLAHHSSLAVGLSGVQKQRSIADIFNQTGARDSLVNLMSLDVVIGSGGVLSHAPKRLQAALMMLDGFGLEGFTELTVDSVFMLPHLGLFSSIHSEAAKEIFTKDCLVPICHTMVPVYNSKKHRDKDLCSVLVSGKEVAQCKRGEMLLLESVHGDVELTFVPSSKWVNLGNGFGKSLTTSATISGEGLLLDGRNRPIELPKTQSERVVFQQKTLASLDLFGEGGAYV
jgi:uncharacterized protein (TIGR01319 family)